MIDVYSETPMCTGLSIIIGDGIISGMLGLRISEFMGMNAHEASIMSLSCGVLGVDAGSVVVVEGVNQKYKHR